MFLRIPTGSRRATRGRRVRTVVTALVALSLAGAFGVIGVRLVAPTAWAETAPAAPAGAPAAVPQPGRMPAANITANAASAAGLGAPSPVVSSVSRSSDTLDVFGVDLAGRIYHAAWDAGDMNGWRRTTQINGGVAAPGTSVYGVARTESRLDVFAVGLDRRVYTAYWESEWGAAWGGWDPLGDFTVAPNTSVHAVREVNRAMSLFAVGENKLIYTNRYTSAGWTGWVNLYGIASRPDSSVFGVVSNLGAVDIFAVGAADIGYWNSYRNGVWQGWRNLDSGYIKRGADIFPVSRARNVIDIFTVDFDGGYVITRPWTLGAGWGAWSRVLNGRAAGGTSVFAAARNSAQLDVFTVGRDRNIYTAGWNSPSGWAGWWNIGATVPAGGSAFAVSRATDILDVFSNLEGSGTKTSNWSPARGWDPWFEVGPRPAGGTSAEMTADIDFEDAGASGWARLRIYSSGDYRFQGHFHHGGILARDIGFAWTIITPSGYALAFTARQTVGGITHANDYDWDVSGRDPEVQNRWAEAVTEGVWYWKARTSLDVRAIVNDIIAASKFAMSSVSTIRSVG